MNERRIRGLTVEELDQVSGGAKNGFDTIISVSTHPGKSANFPDTSTSTTLPHGQAKQL
jgi:hypothetical protein